MRGKEILTGVCILGFFLLGFGFGEGTLRILQLAKFGTIYSVEISDNYRIDENTGLRLPIANSKQGNITFNSLGFRSPEISISKPPNTLRLAFLGSSTTLDVYADGETNWPYLASVFFQQVSSRCRIEYINAGVPGSSTELLVKHFLHHVVPLAPDMVVFTPGDISADTRELAKNKGIYSKTQYQPSWLTHYSLLWAKIEKNIDVIKLQRVAHLGSNKLDFVPENLSWPFRRRLEAAISTFRKHSSVIAIVNIQGQLRHEQPAKQQLQAANSALFAMPYMSIKGLLAARSEYRRVMIEVSANKQVIFIDSDETVPGDTSHYVDSIHLTPAGSRLVARQVSNALLVDKNVKRLIEQCISDSE